MLTWENDVQPILCITLKTAVHVFASRCSFICEDISNCWTCLPWIVWVFSKLMKSVLNLMTVKSLCITYFRPTHTPSLWWELFVCISVFAYAVVHLFLWCSFFLSFFFVFRIYIICKHIALSIKTIANSCQHCIEGRVLLQTLGVRTGLTIVLKVYLTEVESCVLFFYISLRLAFLLGDWLWWWLLFCLLWLASLESW